MEEHHGRLQMDGIPHCKPASHVGGVQPGEWGAHRDRYLLEVTFGSMANTMKKVVATSLD